MGSTHPFDDPPRGVPFALGHAALSRDRTNASASQRPNASKAVDALRPPHPGDEAGNLHSFLTSNPAPVVHDDGSVLLMFKSRRYEGEKHGQMTLGVARAKHYLGPYEVAGKEPVFSANKFGEVEDPFVWKSAEGYEMIAKDMTGKIVGEKHAGVHARSKDGLHWELAKRPKAWTRALRWDDGTTQVMVARTPVPVDRKRPPDLSLRGDRDGPGGFANMTQSFNVAVPIDPRSDTQHRDAGTVPRVMRSISVSR